MKTKVLELNRYIAVVRQTIKAHEVRYAEIYRRLSKDLAEKSQGDIPLYRHKDIMSQVEFMQTELDTIQKLEAQLSGLQQALFIME